jgi:hypothetical protein
MIPNALWIVSRCNKYIRQFLSQFGKRDAIFDRRYINAYPATSCLPELR